MWPRGTAFPGVAPGGVAALGTRNGRVRSRNKPIAPPTIAAAFPAADSDAPSSSRSPAPSRRLRRRRFSTEGVPDPDEEQRPDDERARGSGERADDADRDVLPAAGVPW